MVLYAGVTELADVLDLGSSVLAAWEFKSLRPHQKAICGSDSVVECDLAKVEVAGSNPVFRSTSNFGEIMQTVFAKRRELLLNTCGCSSMVEPQPSKLVVSVRSRSPAPLF